MSKKKKKNLYKPSQNIIQLSNYYYYYFYLIQLLGRRTQIEQAKPLGERGGHSLF